MSGKRLFDICFSLIAIVFTLPFILLFAFIIKWTSKGPAFYAAQRIGQHKKQITCWKLRTMHQNADVLLHTLLNSDPKTKQEWEQKYKLQKDVRVTKIGHFLRKTFLDELPQFWNVLKGELSIVGPRPVTQEEMILFIEHGAEIVFSVKPGLTGLWQTSARTKLSYPERIALEKHYVENQSFVTDLFFIAKTIPCMILSKGVF